MPRGGATCTTSAPKSARVWLAWAPAALVEKSRTRKPSRGPAGASAVRLSAFMGSWFRPVAMTIECPEISETGRAESWRALALGPAAPAGGVAEDLAEGLVGVGARLAGQPEDPLADDVALDLVAAAGDRHDPAVEEVDRRRVAWLAVGPGDAPAARDLHRRRRPQGRDDTKAELDQRGSRRVGGARHHRRHHPRAELGLHVVIDVGPGDQLADDRVGGPPPGDGQPDQGGREPALA